MPEVGLEPATFRLQVERSNRLSYSGHVDFISSMLFERLYCRRNLHALKIHFKCSCNLATRLSIYMTLQGGCLLKQGSGTLMWPFITDGYGSVGMVSISRLRLVTMYNVKLFTLCMWITEYSLVKPSRQSLKTYAWSRAWTCDLSITSRTL